MKTSLVIDMIRAHSSGKGFDEAVERLAEDEIRHNRSDLASEIRKACDNTTLETGEIMIDNVAPECPDFIIPMRPDVKMSDVFLDMGTAVTMEHILLERDNAAALPRDVGPSRKILLIGPPGCGKTMTAKALAYEFGQTMAYLRLDAMMSLGRSGYNIGEAFDYASRTNSVLFIDDLDAVIGSKDDVSESKRIIGSIQQNMDLFPGVTVIASMDSSCTMNQATIRRFDKVIRLRYPDEVQRLEYIGSLFDGYLKGREYDMETLMKMTAGMSYADIRSIITSVIRDVAIQGLDVPLDSVYLKRCLEQSGKMPSAETLREVGLTLREVELLTGIPKSTLSRRESKRRR